MCAEAPSRGWARWHRSRSWLVTRGEPDARGEGPRRPPPCLQSMSDAVGTGYGCGVWMLLGFLQGCAGANQSEVVCSSGGLDLGWNPAGLAV